MTENINNNVEKIKEINFIFNVSKTTWASLALLAGLHVSASALAASQDSLRPAAPAPSVLDPQSDKDETGLGLPQKKTQIIESTAGNNRTRIRIKSLKLTGNTVYSSDELLSVLSDGNDISTVTGKLTFDDMQKLAAKITAFYQKNGYIVAQAVLPQQDVTDGTLTIQIIEGRIDQVLASPEAWNKDNRLVESFRSLYTSQTLSTDALTNTLARLGEATVTVDSINLQAGQKTGGSDIVLSTKPLPLFFYGFTSDNMGNKSTGGYRVNSFVGGNSWLTDGDYTRFEFGTTDQYNRSRRFDLTYSLPFGFSGWTGSARTWSTQYNLGGTFASTHSTGDAQAGEVALSYALQRSSSARADWKSGYSFVNLTDKIATGNSNRARHSQTVWSTLSGYVDDTALSTRARNIYSVNTTVGQLAFDDATASATDATGAQTKGTFAIFNASGSREQILFDAWSLYGSARGQVATTNLDSYHKMSLGGSTAVRAYAGGETTADTAAIGTAELRYLYPFQLFEKDTTARIAIFYDLGWARINTNAIASTPPVANTATRGGYGVELNLFWNSTLAWQIFWAHTADDTRISQVDGKRSRLGTSLSGSF